MPRPAVKRSRLATRTLGASKQTGSQIGSRDISRSPRSDAVGNSLLANGADPSDVIRQLRNQTPLSKAQEFAIGSSPGTEQGATGSRPPTRARGYSSTLSIAGRKGDTSSRIPGTPAFESSILSNFRRRPRQASILHMMQNEEDGSSDLDDDEFLGGLSPEDESTPLNISRGKSLVLRPAASSPDRSPSLLSSGTSSKRKRTAEGTEIPKSPLDVANSTPGTPRTELETRDSGTPVPLSIVAQSPATLSETMVPPMSSPVPGLTHEVSTPESDRLQSRTKKPQNTKAARPIDSKLQIPTAALQDQLLPRRRQRRVARRGASKFEVLSESEDDDVHSTALDDDELSFSPMQKRSQTRRQPTTTKSVSSNRAVADSASHGKDSKTAKRHGASSCQEASGGKENELIEASSPLSSALDTDELDSEFDLEHEAPDKTYLSEELRLQALKFAEVDKWQMEFEDVITVGTQESGTFR
ncbi:uncharacterized protein DSM5745_02669 [Aspergillus mulundensis]|uniref:Uncharacterized protein n=1 Tax=Aspergillus mulundensis TaxID=1810919 RepID=A0A3D8SX94_9EURO|nr:Uncharacterized protein DSM5745_02669 [Aspergillus mulundensis]RDW90894.1 Uncharacterized protein DSM5745_02669 [Aspergillus mulundensis]